MILSIARTKLGGAGRLFRMSQDVRARALKATTTIVHCGDRPGDLRVKVERRSRGRLEQASLRVRALVSRVKSN